MGLKSVMFTNSQQMHFSPLWERSNLEQFSSKNWWLKGHILLLLHTDAFWFIIWISRRFSFLHFLPNTGKSLCLCGHALLWSSYWSHWPGIPWLSPAPRWDSQLTHSSKSSPLLQLLALWLSLYQTFYIPRYSPGFRPLSTAIIKPSFSMIVKAVSPWGPTAQWWE